jgi:Fe-S cluster assembly protein SufD
MEAVAVEKGFAPDLASAGRPRPGEPAWLADRRRGARERFEGDGFPSARLEEWRYTNVGPIVETPWRGDANASAPEVRAGSDAPGVRVLRLAEALAEMPAELERAYGLVAGEGVNAFAALNLAIAEQVAVVAIAPGAVVPAPIEIFHGEPSPGAAAYPRCLVLAGERSEAAVVERFEGEGTFFRDAVTEIALGDGAILTHAKLQQEGPRASHVQTISVRQARGSRFASENLAFGARLARTDLTVVLDGEGAECRLDGLFVGGGAQHLDNHTTIDHATPHGASRELYKGILDGRARGVFHGKIVVRPHAQKTDAMQTNNNLLLSREALVNSTPALEIFADDVKCRHGSTIGQLDAAALFYLRSRGIGEAEARALLTWAFAADVADRVRIPALRAEIARVLGVRLGGAAREEIPS